MRPASSTKLPERLGRFEVVEALGRSANAEFFGAFDPEVDRVVAVKTLRKARVESDRAVARTLSRWRKEAALSGLLAHPGIVAIYDYGETAGVFYLAMEFVQGHRLAAYFERGMRFSAPDAVSIAVQVLAALAHAHERDVRHGAISPASVVLTTRGEAKVAEFGSVSVDSADADDASVPGYIAPERYSGDKVDRRADLFAVGALLFHLLTGRAAYAGSLEQIAYRVCRGTTPLPSRVDPQLERYDGVMRRALARSPAERFFSAAEFAAALVEVEGGAVRGTVSPEALLSEPGQLGSLHEPSPEGPAEEETDSAQQPEDAIGTGEDRADHPRRFVLVAAVAAVAVVAAATIAMLADWSVPELRPRAPRGERTPAAVVATPPAPTAIAPARERPSERARFDGTAAVAEALQRDRDAATVAAIGERTAPHEAPPPRPRTAELPASVAGARTAPTTADQPSVSETSAEAPPRQPTAATAARPSRTEAPDSDLPPATFWRDQAIAFQVATRLAFNDKLYRGAIKVECAGGAVTLRGDVPSNAHVTNAIAVTRTVAGVRSVRSELRVGAPEYVFPGAISPP